MSERSAAIDPPRPLLEGERLDRPTFHVLYEAMPPGSRAELIGGVVSMPGPFGSDHGRALVPTIVWFSYYAENSSGVKVLDNATTILGWRSEPQPDARPDYRRCRAGRGRRSNLAASPFPSCPRFHPQAVAGGQI
jgi:hypothetical protein